MFKEPFLPGMKVCLNPESNNYEKLKEYFGDDFPETGIVLETKVGYKDLIDFKLFHADSAREINVFVRFADENDTNTTEGKFLTIKAKDLLKIESKLKTITKYRFDMLSSVYLIEGVGGKHLIERIIKGGEKIYSMQVFDDEWRRPIIEANNMSCE